MIDATIKNGMIILYQHKNNSGTGGKLDLQTLTDIIVNLKESGLSWICCYEVFADRSLKFYSNDLTELENKIRIFFSTASNLCQIFASETEKEWKKWGWKKTYQFWNVSAHDGHGSSEQSELRFRNVMDNFASIYTMVKKYDPDSLKYQIKKDGKFVSVNRRPVFLTLTVPNQTISDYDVKEKCLIPFLDNLVKTYFVKMYIWKAETQLRGAIHFHLVLDCYVQWDDIRRLWYKHLKKNGLMDQVKNLLFQDDDDLEKSELEKASRITWVVALDDVETMKQELSGYFGADRDDDGKIKYKHDKKKTVREISGRSWGCTKNLQYPSLSVDSLNDDLLKEIEETAIEKREIFDRNKPDFKLCEIAIFKQTKFIRDGSEKRSVKKNVDFPQIIHSLFHSYNLFYGLNVYSNDINKLNRSATLFFQQPIKIKQKTTDNIWKKVNTI